MKPKFTPGPWELWDDVHPKDDPRIGMVILPEAADAGGGNKYIACGGGNNLANARLVAAAPEMYDAMAEFVRRVESGEVRSKRTYAQFKMILAKINGEKK